MKIPVGIMHDAKVNQALLQVNGKACDHTFTQGAQIFELSKLAESRLEALRLPKKYRQGAQLEAVSGSPVPNKYKFNRVGTRIMLERGATDWFLVSVKREVIHATGGYNILRLTEKQDEAVVELVRQSYSTVIDTSREN
jgi:hypothetical protein